MSEIQRLPQVVNPNPVHPNAKTTTLINNGTTTTKLNISLPVCRNCKTQTTPLWRRDETGQVLCNACGLFLKLHGRPRPISLKTDTIKLRNRIKQPNFLKKHGTNTPELKLKDSRVSLANAGVNTANGGKKLPKPGRKRSPPPDFAVQPKHHQGPQFQHQHQHQHQHQQPQQFHQQQHQQHPPHLIHHLPGIPGSSTAIPLPLSHPARGPSHGHLPHHLHHLSGLSSSQVQLLHYPSSTPTQFAPGLQRITSPLMLSTTLLNARSVSSTGAASPKSSLSAAQAAGALENMLNVLGPSATFKGSSHEMNGVSLMGHSAKTPLSALKQESRILPGIPPSSAPSTGASTNVIASPSFGPQFHLDSPKRDNSQGLSKPSLPPLQLRTQNATSASTSLAPTTSAPNSGPLPPIQSLHPVKMEERNALDGENARVVSHSTGEVQSTQNTAPNSGNAGNSQQQSGQNEGHEQSSNRSSNNNNNNNGDNGNSNNNNDGNNGNNGNNDGLKKANDADCVAYENTLLKTRISELELVNDLYRTRIMELEAMEQAARLRESSMRRRLDEVIALQAQNAARQGDEGEEKKAKTDQ